MIMTPPSDVTTVARSLSPPPPDPASGVLDLAYSSRMKSGDSTKSDFVRSPPLGVLEDDYLRKFNS